MGGIRKNKRRKKYQFDKNRQRMKKKITPRIKCKIVDDKWVNSMTIEKNLKQMGLVYNVNKDISNPIAAPEDTPMVEVVQELEEEAHAPREKLFRITKNAVEFISYMLDKYGDDYKAMTKDKRNILQLTWKQFRTKVKMFRSIPEQYNEYLKKKEGSTVSSDKVEGEMKLSV